MSKPSPPSEEGGASSVDEGVAAAMGVDEGALLLPFVFACRERDGVGVASGVAKRDCWAGGVANADGVVDRPLLLRREASPGDEKVFPIGLENESSGEEGPKDKGEEFTIRLKKFSHTFTNINTNIQRERLTLIEIDRRGIGSHG